MYKTGGKQGCRLGPMIFNSVYSRAVGEIKRMLRDACLTLQVPSAHAAPLSAADSCFTTCSCEELCDTLFVDDTTYFIDRHIPKELDAKVDLALDIIIKTMRKYGAKVNWNPGKTEAMLWYSGKNSAKAARLAGLRVGALASSSRRAVTSPISMSCGTSSIWALGCLTTLARVMNAHGGRGRAQPFFHNVRGQQRFSATTKSMSP